MATLIAKIDAMNTNLNLQFSNLQSQLFAQATQFQEEISKLRLELVSRVEFERLENRIDDLESGGLANVQIDFLQEQLKRLDPANKSLAFAGFKSSSANGRRTQIEVFLKSILADDVPSCSIFQKVLRRIAA